MIWLNHILVSLGAVVAMIFGGYQNTSNLSTTTIVEQPAQQTSQNPVTDKSITKKIQPKAPQGYLTPDNASIPAGYVYTSDYGSLGTTIVYTYTNSNFAKITFSQLTNETYSKLVSDFTGRRTQAEKTVATLDKGVVLEGFDPDGIHHSYRLIYNRGNSPVLEIYTEGDPDITPQILEELLQHMHQ